MQIGAREQYKSRNMFSFALYNKSPTQTDLWQLCTSREAHSPSAQNKSGLLYVLQPYRDWKNHILGFTLAFCYDTHNVMTSFFFL